MSQVERQVVFEGKRALREHDQTAGGQRLGRYEALDRGQRALRALRVGRRARQYDQLRWRGAVGDRRTQACHVGIVRARGQRGGCGMADQAATHEAAGGGGRQLYGLPIQSIQTTAVRLFERRAVAERSRPHERELRQRLSSFVGEIDRRFAGRDDLHPCAHPTRAGGEQAHAGHTDGLEGLWLRSRQRQ
jgi:hypothetical protein